MSDLGREPLQIVEIDMDRCSLTYASSPCAAVLGTTGVRKCYNTFQTCQDPTNYDQGTETLLFAKNQSGLPFGERIYPALVSVSTNPLEINPRPGLDRIGALGKRARVTMVFQDFVDDDRQTDPYVDGRIDGTAQTDEGGYRPQTRGTFFGKLRRRWPHYLGREVRIRDGYGGDAISSMPVRYYVISEWAGPDASGRVTVIAKDILDLAENDKALCPKPSQGEILDGITADYLGPVTLTPAGIGADYATSGRASLSNEIVTFTRSGDVVTITHRGVDGTTAAAHSAGKTFQQCARWEKTLISAVARDLLRDYADVPSTYIPFADWADEVSRWMASFRLTRTIPKPVGVLTLMGELAELGAQWWWDERVKEIKMRANRPQDVSETLETITDAADILAGSLQAADMPEARLSQVLIWHGLRDPARSVTEAENYDLVYVALDADAERDEAFGQSAVLEIYTPWLGAGSNSAVRAAGSRILRRYLTIPREVTLSLDIKDRSRIEVADLISLTTRVLTDDTGNSTPTTAQVVALEETMPGHMMRIKVQSFEIGGRWAYIMEPSAPDYGSASDSEKATGAFIVPGSGAFADGTGPYLMW